MQPFRLQLFGGFTLASCDGRKIALPASKERALLAYLALNPGKPFSRGQLTGLLWGSWPELRARHSLSQALSSLNKALLREAGDSAIRRGRQAIILAEDQIETDVSLFYDQVASDEPSTLKSAVALYQPGLLADLDIGEPGFEEWQQYLRSECHEMAVQAGLKYLARADEQDAVDAAIITARRLLAIDPYLEPAHQALMRLYLKAGQPAAARRQFEDCRRTVEEELGIAPAPETARLCPAALSPAPQERPEQDECMPGSAPKHVTSIVVAPFANIEGDPTFDYLVNGLTDDFITALARFRSLFVISSNTVFALKAAAEDATQLSRRLGVRYVVKGSLRKIGNKLRVNVHLLDGKTGQYVWVEHYDISAPDLLDLPGETTREIVGRIASWLESDAMNQVRRKPTEKWEAYDHLLRGMELYHRNWHSQKTVFEVIPHFERAIELDPEFGRAHAWLACAKSGPWFEDREDEKLDVPLALGQRALELDPLEPEAHRILGAIYLTRSQFDEARYHFQTGHELNPNHSDVLAHYARFHTHFGDPEEALRCVHIAQRLNPLHPPWYWVQIGAALHNRRDYEAALKAFSHIYYRSFYEHLFVAACHAELGRSRNASYNVELALSDMPGLNLSNVVGYLPYRRADHLKHMIAGLKRAGLPA